MQRKFLTNLFLLVGANLLIKPFWILGVDRAVQNAVGNEQYGIYTNLFAFSLLFVMLLDFGINNYASAHAAKHPQLISKQFSSLVSLKLLFSAAYLLVTLGAGWLYGFPANGIFLLMILGINQVLAFFILFIRSHVSGLQLFKTDALMSVTDRALMIIFCSMMIWMAWFDVNIMHFVFAQTAGYAGSLLVCFFILKPHLAFFRPSFNKAMLASFLKETWPYAALALLMTLYTRADVILIKKMLPGGDAENGIYAQAGRLLEAANMLAAMVSSMLLPLFAKMLREKLDVNPLIRTTLSVMFLPAVMLAVFCHFYRQEIMLMLYPQSSLYTADIFGVLIFSFTGLAAMYIFGTWLTAKAALKTLVITASVCLVINLALNLALIPGYGAYGSAWAAVVTSGCAGLMNFVYARRIGKHSLYVPDLLKFVFFAALFSAVAYFVHSSGTSLFTGMLLCLLTGVILLFSLRIENYSSLRKSAALLIRR